MESSYKTFWLESEWNVQISRDIIFSHLQPRGRDQAEKKNSKNCMKCPDLHRQVIFTSLYPLEDGVGGQVEKKKKKNIFARTFASNHS